MRAILAGADGVLLTRTPTEEVPEAVRALLRGEQPLPRTRRMRSVLDVEADHAPTPSRKSGPVGSVLLYGPRFARHLYRRLRSSMPLRQALASTRERMRDYH